MIDISATEAIALFVLATYLALTVVAQLMTGPLPLGRIGAALVPRWAFFSRAPIRVDYSLLLRDRRRDGSLGPWREAPFAREHRWWHACFDPASRCRRVVYILTIQTVAALQSANAPPLADNPHYAALLRAALSFPHTDDADARETLIMRSFGLLSNRPPQPIVRSGLRSLSSVGHP